MLCGLKNRLNGNQAKGTIKIQLILGGETGIADFQVMSMNSERPVSDLLKTELHKEVIAGAGIRAEQVQ